MSAGITYRCESCGGVGRLPFARVWVDGLLESRPERACETCGGAGTHNEDAALSCAIKSAAPTIRCCADFGPIAYEAQARALGDTRLVGFFDRLRGLVRKADARRARGRAA